MFSALMVAGLAACSTSPASIASGTRPLTAAEAERLAVVRYNGYSIGVRSFSGLFTDGRVQVALSGWIDLVDHVGYGLASPTDVRSGSSTTEPFLTRWTLKEVGTRTPDGLSPVLPMPTDAWTSDPLVASDSFLAAGQLILLNLGSDRPENPQLLVQSTAQWVRSDHVGEVAVDVMDGPSAEGSTAPSGVRYWVDTKGVLHRLEIQLGTSQWSLIDFVDAPEAIIDYWGTDGG